MVSDWEWWGIRFGDWLNVLGLALSVVGFGASICGAWRAARAAGEAKRQALAISAQIQSFQSAVNLSQISKTIEFLKAMNRTKISKEALLLYYGDLAKNISAQIHNPLLSESERNFLGDMFNDIRSIEASLEQFGTNSREFDWGSVNQRLSDRLDKMVSILARLERSSIPVGAGHDS